MANSAILRVMRKGWWYIVPILSQVVEVFRRLRSKKKGCEACGTVQPAEKDTGNKKH